MFLKNKEFYWFNHEANNSVSQEIFYFTGIIFGLAFYNDVLLNSKFPIALYQKGRNFKVGRLFF
jgi:hypothetical protein